MKAAGPARSLEARIARLLMAGTYTAMAFMALGVLLMAMTGRSPRDVAPTFDPGRLIDDLASVQPAGFLWAGVLLVLATPLARVVAALAGFVRAGERELALVAALILAVIAAGVVVGTTGG